MRHLVFLVWCFVTLVALEPTSDVLTTNSSSYNSNDPITVTLVTENRYSQVIVTINSKEFSTKTDSANGLTGNIQFNGFITNAMGQDGATSALVIEVKTKLFAGGKAGFVSRTTVACTFSGSEGALYFTNPPNNPAQLVAGYYFRAVIYSNVAFDTAEIILGDQPFCSLGIVFAHAFASCIGKVPANLPDNAHFLFTGTEPSTTTVSIVGPTVQLIPVFNSNEFTVASVVPYYSSLVQFSYAVSANNFYASTIGTPNSLGYKPIDQSGNALTPISFLPVGASIKQAAVYTMTVGDQVWAIDVRNVLYCGTDEGGFRLSKTPTLASARILSITVGPTGVWAVDYFGGLFNYPSPQCNSNYSWVKADVDSVDFAAAGLTGVYYHTVNGIFQLVSPGETPQLVSAYGPSSIIHMSASTLDDSLVVVDVSENVWILTGPSGNWYQTSISYSAVICYSITDLYAYYQNDSGSWNVDFVSLNDS